MCYHTQLCFLTNKERVNDSLKSLAIERVSVPKKALYKRQGTNYLLEP